MEVLKKFRALPEFDKTALIILTAVVEKSMVLDALKAGAIAYIAKPTTTKEISKIFDEVVDWLKKKKIRRRQLRQTFFTHIQKLLVTCGNKCYFVERC